MSDITKCKYAEELKCPRRNNCYRHTAPDNPYGQSYGAFMWGTDESDYFECQGYYAEYLVEEDKSQ